MSKTMARYALSRTVSMPYAEADRRVREELATEGFGVLTQIDVQSTLKTKLGVDMPPYEILGGCNPTLAHQAITLEPDIGLLLPCNVVIRRRLEDDATVVEILDPVVQLELSENPALRALAHEARARLERVLNRVGGDN